MLKSLRDNLKYLSWILWIVILVFLVSAFLGFDTGVNLFDGTGGTVAATIGDEPVTMTEFERQYRLLEDQYRQMYGEQFTPEMAQQLRLPRQVLDQMINQKVLLAEARRMGLAVTDAELQAAILDVSAFKDGQGRFIGQEAYSQLLQANGYTVGTFEEQMRAELLTEKLRNALLASVYVGPDEVEKAYREQVERVKIRYVQVEGAQLEGEVQVSPAELKSYFEAHKEQFRVPEQREAAYLLVETAKLADQVKIDDEELRRYYQEHKDEFSTEEQVRARHILAMVNDQQNDEAARKKIEDARRRIQGGEDFAAVARAVSEDTGSQENGGDLGFFGRGRMVPEFEQAAFGAQPGQLVGPIKSSFGYHLLEVTDRRPGGTQPFDQAKEQIRSRLAAERVNQLAEAKAESLSRQLAEDEPENAQALQALAQNNPGVSFAESGRFGRQEPVSGLGFAPAFNNAAFGLEKGKVSEAIQVPRGWAIPYLKEIHEPHVPELAKVEARVRQAVVTQKRQRLAMDRLKTARAAGKSLEQIAAELGSQIQESTEFGARGSVPGIGFSPELTKAALSAQPGQVVGPIAVSQGAVLFQVTERKGVVPAEFAKAREQTLATLRQEKLGRLMASLIDKRRRELGVVYDAETLQRFGITGAVQES